MHSKDPPEKYLVASSRRSTRLRSEGERVEGGSERAEMHATTASRRLDMIGY